MYPATGQFHPIIRRPQFEYDSFGQGLLSLIRGIMPSSLSYPIFCYNAKPTASWRNWQTQRIQNPSPLKRVGSSPTEATYTPPRIIQKPSAIRLVRHYITPFFISLPLHGK